MSRHLQGGKTESSVGGWVLVEYLTENRCATLPRAAENQLENAESASLPFLPLSARQEVLAPLPLPAGRRRELSSTTPKRQNISNFKLAVFSSQAALKASVSDQPTSENPGSGGRVNSFLGLYLLAAPTCSSSVSRGHAWDANALPPPGRAQQDRPIWNRVRCCWLPGPVVPSAL